MRKWRACQLLPAHPVNSPAPADIRRALRTLVPHVEYVVEIIETCCSPAPLIEPVTFLGAENALGATGADILSYAGLVNGLIKVWRQLCTS